MKTKESRVIAFAIDCWENVKISLTEEYLGTGCNEDYQLFSKYRYTVRKDDIEEWTEWSGEIESHSYRRIKPAWDKFKELIDGVRDGIGERRITTVNLCDGFIEDYEDDIDPQPYCRSASAGDYSPSCPWNAPGMSIHDFI